jgi:molybdopterin synthase catalytic subunit
MARLQREDFDIGREIRALADKNAKIGGVVSFLGTVRDFSRGQEVVKLDFTHYPGMAEAELARLEREAREKFDVTDCLVIHRTGEIGINENIVLIVAAGVHRGPAFDACRWMIEELKKRVPIWKNEYTADGSRWVEDHP